VTFFWHTCPCDILLFKITVVKTCMPGNEKWTRKKVLLNPNLAVKQYFLLPKGLKTVCKKAKAFGCHIFKPFSPSPSQSVTYHLNGLWNICNRRFSGPTWFVPMTVHSWLSPSTSLFEKRNWVFPMGQIGWAWWLDHSAYTKFYQPVVYFTKASRKAYTRVNPKSVKSCQYLLGSMRVKQRIKCSWNWHL